MQAMAGYRQQNCSHDLLKKIINSAGNTSFALFPCNTKSQNLLFSLCKAFAALRVA
jgi:hypothetical protein